MNNLKGIHKLLYFIMLMIISTVTSAQIANIESDRIQTDTTGWAGGVKLGLNITKDVNTVTEASGDAHVQFKTLKSLFLLRMSANFIQAGNTTFESNSFFHLRHNYKVNRWLRWEEFTQIQTNKLTGIKYRYLLGTGPRFKLSESKWLALYIGTSIMYEYENEIGPENTTIQSQHPRSSNYISFTINASENLKVVHTSYFQFLYDFPDDHRFNTQTDFEFKISKKLAFNLSYRLLFDSKPAFNIPNTTYALENALVWKF